MIEIRSIVPFLASLAIGLLSGFAGRAEATLLSANSSCLERQARAAAPVDCNPAAAPFGKGLAFQQHHAAAEVLISPAQAALVGDVGLAQSLSDEAAWKLTELSEPAGPSGELTPSLPASFSSVTGMKASGPSLPASSISIDVRRLRVTPAAASAGGVSGEETGVPGFAVLAALGAALTAIGLAARRAKRNAARGKTKRAVQQDPLRHVPAE